MDYTEPGHVLPLFKLAYGYARLASGFLDSEFGADGVQVIARKKPGRGV